MKRILHAVGSLNAGGVENWLLHLLRRLDRERFRIDFLTHTTEPALYDDEVRALGSKIIPCPHPHRPWSYGRRLCHVLRNHGPYDVVHSHHHLYSGHILRLAHRKGVRVRIAHSHSAPRVPGESPGRFRRAYMTLMDRWIRTHATMGLACSRQAGKALLGERWGEDPRWRVHPYGIDLSPFQSPIDRDAVRRELGIPPNAFVVGHVGRFVPPKNHLFLLRIASEVAKRDETTRVLLVGDGELRSRIESQIAGSNLGGRAVLTGIRRDVPRLLRGAVDVLLFPSVFEGVPLATVEAQAAGVTCVVSDAVSEEAEIIAPLFRRISLSAPLSQWVNAVLESRQIASRLGTHQALTKLQASRYNIQRSVEEIESIYDA